MKECDKRCVTEFNSGSNYLSKNRNYIPDGQSEYKNMFADDPKIMKQIIIGVDI